LTIIAQFISFIGLHFPHS